MKKLAVLFPLLLITVSVFAQRNYIKGTVIEKQTGEPLPGARVFLNQTTIGALTDTEGRFEIKDIPPGNYKLVVSMLGFETYTKELDELDQTLEIFLDVNQMELNEIVVTAKGTRSWRRNLARFERELIGITRNAFRTKILNPEALNFDNKPDTLIAWANAPLEIENRALGYKVTFFLNDFSVIEEQLTIDGYAVFEELEAGSSDQQRRWNKERERAYTGSFTHFIHSLFSNQLRQDGYEVFYTRNTAIFSDEVLNFNRVVSPRSIFRHRPGMDTIELFNSRSPLIRIEYTGEPAEPRILDKMKLARGLPQFSWISLPNENKAIIDIRSGKEVSEFRSELIGYWGLTSRIADLLPNNYKFN